VRAFRAGRDAAAVEAVLARLEAEAGTDRNLMPAILDAARAGATVGEICDAFRAAFGTWRESPVF
jgi:methylmalonyl-CoA mutase N-terminal domain/subunit